MFEICPNVSQARAFIKSFEKCRLVAYLDKKKKGVWTCGWGSTGPDIVEGTVWTQEQADERFEKFFNRLVNQLLTSIKAPFTENEFNACVCLAYNIGLEAFLNSTLLKKINGLADDKDVANEFLRWDHDDGVQVAGLTRRREQEHNMYLNIPYELG